MNLLSMPLELGRTCHLPWRQHEPCQTDMMTDNQKSTADYQRC